MLTITKDSNFSQDAQKVTSFQEALYAVGTNIIQSASDIYSALPSCDFSMWTDENGKSVEQYKTSLQNAVATIGNDKGMDTLNLICNQIVAYLSECQNIHDKLEVDKQNLSQMQPKLLVEVKNSKGEVTNSYYIDNPQYIRLEQEINAEDKYLEALINDTNNLIATCGTVEFNGNEVSLPQATATPPSSLDLDESELTVVDGTEETVTIDGKEYISQTVVDKNGNKYTKLTPTDGGKAMYVPEASGTPTDPASKEPDKKRTRKENAFYYKDGDRVYECIPDPNSEDNFLVYDATTGEIVGSKPMSEVSTSYQPLSKEEEKTFFDNINTTHDGSKYVPVPNTKNTENVHGQTIVTEEVVDAEGNRYLSKTVDGHTIYEPIIAESNNSTSTKKTKNKDAFYYKKDGKVYECIVNPNNEDEFIVYDAETGNVVESINATSVSSKYNPMSTEEVDEYFGDNTTSPDTTTTPAPGPTPGPTPTPTPAPDTTTTPAPGPTPAPSTVKKYIPIPNTKKTENVHGQTIVTEEVVDQDGNKYLAKTVNGNTMYEPISTSDNTPNTTPTPTPNTTPSTSTKLNRIEGASYFRKGDTIYACVPNPDDADEFIVYDAATNKIIGNMNMAAVGIDYKPISKEEEDDLFN